MEIAALSERLTAALAQGSWGALLLALLAGLATALTPCVYPMIPITVSVFGAKAGVPRGRALALAAVYVGGLAFMYGVLGTGSALLGKAFGSFLASPWVVVPIAGIFAAMALSFFGAFELALPAAANARLARIGGSGFGGAFLMGLVAGFIAAPCTGPPLVAILTYIATTRDAARGFALTATYAVGIGLPFFLVAGFSMSLPRSGRWMESVKSLFGVVLLAFALYFLKNVVPALGRLSGTTTTFLAAALGAVVLGAALGGLHLSFHDRVSARLRKGAGVVLMVAGLFATSNYLLTPRGDIALRWHDDPDAAVAEAEVRGRPLLVDFSADWCLPCKKLEANVFHAPPVARKLRDDFVLLKIDCTSEDDDPRIEAQRRRYQAEGGALPAVRIARADGTLLGRVDDGSIRPEAFLRLLQAAVP